MYIALDPRYHDGAVQLPDGALLPAKTLTPLRSTYALAGLPVNPLSCIAGVKTLPCGNTEMLSPNTEKPPVWPSVAIGLFA